LTKQKQDKSTNLELPRKVPKSFALHVVLEELLWLRIEFACFLSAAKETKGNYVCVEIPPVKRKKEILLVVQSYHTLASDRLDARILSSSEWNDDGKTRCFNHYLLSCEANTGAAGAGASGPRIAPPTVSGNRNSYQKIGGFTHLEVG
jgi:hypothetical protein